LPSSFMIVSSLAFVFSTCLLVSVSRYGYVNIFIFPAHFPLKMLL